MNFKKWWATNNHQQRKKDGQAYAKELAEAEAKDLREAEESVKLRLATQVDELEDKMTDRTCPFRGGLRCQVECVHFQPGEVKVSVGYPTLKVIPPRCRLWGLP